MMVGQTDHELSADEYQRIKLLSPEAQVEWLEKRNHVITSTKIQNGKTSAAVPRPNKYGAKAVVIDGIRFASLKEGRTYEDLKRLRDAGEISDLEVHPKYQFVHNGVMICRYTADFRYRDAEGALVVVDVKGGNATKTRDYRIRKQLMKAFYGITVKET